MSIGATVAVDVHGLDRALTVAASDLHGAMTGPVRRGGLMLQRLVRANASGRPGPRVQTGDYRRGIRLQTGEAVSPAGGLVPFATVYTTSPQGQRLEHGFVGVDSLGRHYHQPPFPHWGPAVEVVEPIVQADLAAQVDKIVRSVA